MIEGTSIWNATRTTDGKTSRMELTDLIRFKNAWYCGFHEGRIHPNHPAGRARIIHSTDGTNWNTAALFDWDCADVRAPNLSITAEDHLMVNDTVFFCSREPREWDPRRDEGVYYQLDQRRMPTTTDEARGVARQCVTWLSPDGTDWSSAYACPTGVNTWRWHASWHNGMGYSMAKSGDLYRTRDGKSWRLLAGKVFPEGKGNEACIAFDHDDTACCIVRDHPTNALIGLAEGPYYQNWTWRDARVDWEGDGTAKPADDVCRAPFGGPKLIRLADGRFVSAARVWGPGRDTGYITLFLFDPQEALFTRFAEFDGTSYGGVAEHDGKLWVTFNNFTASEILMANVEVP